MKEKEIIKWNGNLAKQAKIIVALAIGVLILSFIFGCSLGMIKSNYEKQVNKLTDEYSEHSDKVKEKSSEMNNAKEEQNEIKDKYIKSKNARYTYYGYYQNLKYYIEDKEVTREEFENKIKEYEKEAEETEEYKKAKENYDKIESEYNKLSEKSAELDNKRTEAKRKSDNFNTMYNKITPILPVYMIICVIVVVITVIFYLYISKMEITVTNTRVYGKKAFGKRVDLPLDTISAVGTSLFKGIDIGTSAGKIHFKGIMNNTEIHTEISKLLNERQTEKSQKKEGIMSNAEELKKYKELLDSKAITQEEYEAKKKQLLDL